MSFEAHYLDIIKRKILVFVFSIIGNFKALWWNIETNNWIKVHGKIYFRRLPRTRIIIGKDCRFNSSVNSNLIGINRPCMISTLQPRAQIEVGNNCGFSGTVIGAFKKIKIGNNVRCGANTLITDSDWHLDDPRIGTPKEVIIEENVWLGEDVKILKGVKIGRNTIIGTGSVVTKSIPNNVIAAGNPCKVLKKLNER